MFKATQATQKQTTYWLGVVIIGLTVGLGIQFTQAWVNPSQTAPNGNVAGPLTTGAGAQWKTGTLGVGTAGPAAAGSTLDVNGVLRNGVRNGAYSYITMEDDESPNGVKYIHADSNVIGFLGGDGNWLTYITQAGDSWQKGNASFQGVINTNGYIIAHDSVYNFSNNWAFLGYDAGGNGNAQPQAIAGSAYVNDIYLRSVGKWASQIGGGNIHFDQVFYRYVGDGGMCPPNSIMVGAGGWYMTYTAGYLYCAPIY